MSCVSSIEGDNSSCLKDGSGCGAGGKRAAISGMGLPGYWSGGIVVQRSIAQQYFGTVELSKACGVKTW